MTTGADVTQTQPLQTADDPEADMLAQIFRALGHPVRLKILETLAKDNGACCGQIVNCLPLAQSTVSQHLQVLKDAGLLTCEVKGRSCHYALNTEALARAAGFSAEFFDRLTGMGCTPFGGSQTACAIDPA
ncbi:ArsR family transcriptional regulator [Roseibium hamelinense]|uniref:ArsR family transcriptional regulator n=1 Tax=Roseibium hamelinense TaxID=150831 RepID=A0A562T8E0_9HYPH|nr:metalloregulator ArsR/SmtB family transcription factor [Roseibium hamelinense]MTI43523.1 transcriptional regulator [Roseibium hamelinense]TWI89683.1 ArsR family transcriptional regulator [Roseibium hamelinense]